MNKKKSKWSISFILSKTGKEILLSMCSNFWHLLMQEIRQGLSKIKFTVKKISNLNNGYKSKIFL